MNPICQHCSVDVKVPRCPTQISKFLLQFTDDTGGAQQRKLMRTYSHALNTKEEEEKVQPSAHFEYISPFYSRCFSKLRQNQPFKVVAQQHFITFLMAEFFLQQLGEPSEGHWVITLAPTQCENIRSITSRSAQEYHETTFAIPEPQRDHNSATILLPATDCMDSHLISPLQSR